MIARPSCRCGHEFRWDDPGSTTISVECPRCPRRWFAAFRGGELYAFLEATYSSRNNLERAAAFALGQVIADEEYPEDDFHRAAFLRSWTDAVETRFPRRAPLWWVRLTTAVRKFLFDLTHREAAHAST